MSAILFVCDHCGWQGTMPSHTDATHEDEHTGERRYVALPVCPTCFEIITNKITQGEVA